MEKRLYRSEKDHVLAGVCGGIGEHFDIDSTIVRLLWVISILVFDVGILLYIIAVIIIPKKEQLKDSTEEHKAENQDLNLKQKEKSTKDTSGKLLGYGLIIIGIFLMFDRLEVFRWMDAKIAFPILLIIGGIMVLKNAFTKQ